MHRRARFSVPRRLLDHIRAPLMGAPAFIPTLQAYGGLRARGVGADKASDTLGRLGSLEVRLARTAAEVRRAQRLRFDVFYGEMSAIPDAAARLSRRDVDAYDAVCDHLLVVDHGASIGNKPAVVGTYRLLRQNVAERHGGFYSQGEFEVDALLTRHPGARFLELGRSCVLEPYRNKRTVELLWHGIWTYVLRNRMDVMIGCASLEGTDPAALALQLAFLHHHAAAPEPWRTRALPGRYVDMNRLPKDAVDPKMALKTLPPLIKGYLRLGASFADGAVVDRQFGTTDVFVVLPVAAISARYIEHFGAGAERHAA
ncbi:GNAT family N-acyltransferase [Xanthobacteraceae bacterium Astr-EGSB]|uniref:GNAT family N-acetyltransferase n=1 Tax=Astrobacterium formosum TaxID=3069710 RepID=UPI0027B073BE|nr:GNAT family N-acyltransferase [Xanthobacteraceae bacterium Astr-EGSB]